ncbi:MAG: hypothetical protein HUU46_05730 [Candidatus Hydrogenedentes bacterium]|nr:hypothetical protein [Candidatus Hydrogenedentota bacterium]
MSTGNHSALGGATASRVLLVLSFSALSLLAAADDFAPRVEILTRHVQRLHAITVPDADAPTKAEKLKQLEDAVAKGAANSEEFIALYNQIDDVRMWLWSHATDQPRIAAGSFAESDGAWTISAPSLTVTLAKSDLGITVKTPEAAWQFAPCEDRDIVMPGKAIGLLKAGARNVEEFRTGYSVGLIAVFSEFAEAPGLEVRLCLNVIGNALVCEFIATDDGQTFTDVYWPKAIVTGITANDVAVIPHMQGMLLPGDWHQEIKQHSLVNSRTLYMPWWGHLANGVRGAGPGVVAIIETPDDAGADYRHAPGGPTVVAPYWAPSLGKMRYQRVIRYIFDDDATYVTLAKRYRQHVQETGRFVSLSEKALRTPNVNEVIGRPVIHIGALYHFVREASLFNKERIENNHGLTTFEELANGLNELKVRGVEDAYIHLDGWGFYGYDNGHPDVLPPGEEQGGWDGLRAFADTCDRLGYLFAVHDQYRDFYLNAVSFDDRLVAYRFDGTCEQHSTWCGGPQTILNPRFAPDYVRRNHDLFAANGVQVKGAYLDVFSIVPIEESSEKSHPVSRSECARYRADCFDLLRARGYVVSSEEPTDYLAPHIDLVHHGPYATYPNIGGGDARGIPVPLWNLVYHDALLLPWDMGENGGWGTPAGDAGYLHCFLNAGLPYLGLGAGPDQIARMKEACALNQRCATSDMVSHEFLDDAYRQQRTTYSDGTTVTIDFAAKSYTIEPPANG